MPNQLGQKVPVRGVRDGVLCTKAGQGPVQCHGADMVVQQARKLPSSD